MVPFSFVAQKHPVRRSAADVDLIADNILRCLRDRPMFAALQRGVCLQLAREVRCVHFGPQVPQPSPTSSLCFASLSTPRFSPLE